VPRFGQATRGLEDSQGYMMEDQTKRKMMKKKKKNHTIGSADGCWPRLLVGDRKIGAKPRW
jgi:hypothetical protein